MHTGRNNLCDFAIIRGLQSANVIPQSVSSTTNSCSKLYNSSYSKEQLLSKESRNSNAKEKCYSQTPKLPNSQTP